MSYIYSSDKAMAGVWRAFVVDVTDDDATVSLYIPALHREQMPFKDAANPKEGLRDEVAGNKSGARMRKCDYPKAQLCAWQVRTPLVVGDAVWVMFENGDANYPVVVGQLGTLLPKATMTTAEGSISYGIEGVGLSIDIPDGYGTVETYEKEIDVSDTTYHGWWHSNNFDNHDHGHLRRLSLSAGRMKRADIFGFVNCAVIDDRLCIATMPNIGGSFPVSIGDYLDVKFDDGTVWNCILGDVKGADANNAWGHNDGKSVVEIIYWDYSQNPQNGQKKVSRITKVGNYWSGMIQFDGIINTAVQWALSIASDSSHGYSQAHRNGPDYDCSSLICTAYRKAGLDVPVTSTHYMKQEFCKRGFKDVTNQVNLKTGEGTKPGDIMLDPATHTEMVAYPDGRLVGAHSDKDGKQGESTADEIYLCAYHNNWNRGWKYVLRYEEANT